MRFSLAGSSLLPGSRAHRARFPTCGVIRVAGYSVVWDCDPTPVFPLKSTKRSAAAILGRSALSLLFHGALRNILLSAGFPAMFHMITPKQMFVNWLLQKNFHLLPSRPNRINSTSNLYILTYLTFRQSCKKVDFRQCSRKSTFLIWPIVIGFGNFAEPDLSYSRSGNSAEKLPPASGIGDWASLQAVFVLCLRQCRHRRRRFSSPKEGVFQKR